MGAAATKLMKKGKKTAEQAVNQDNQEASSGQAGDNQGILGGLDASKIAAEVGKNISAKSEEISGAIASNLQTQLNLSDDKKQTAQKGINTALKTVGDKLAHKDDETVKDANTAGGAAAAPVAGLASGGILSHVAKNLTENSDKITDTVAANISTQLELSKEQSNMAKKGVDAALKQVGSALASQNGAESNEGSNEASKTEKAPKSSAGLFGMDTSKVASEIGKNLSEKSEQVSEAVVSKVAEVVPQLNLTDDKKESLKATVGSALKQVGAKLESGEGQETTAASDESKPSTESKGMFGIDSSKVTSVLGKNLSEKSHEISEQVVSNIARVAPQLTEHKEAAEKAVDSALKTIGGKLSGSGEHSQGAEEEKPKENTSEQDGGKTMFGMNTSNIASQIEKTITEQGDKISDTVTNTVSEQLNLSEEKKESVKSAVDSALNAVSEKLSEQANGGDGNNEEKSQETEKKDQETSENGTVETSNGNDVTNGADKDSSNEPAEQGSDNSSENVIKQKHANEESNGEEKVEENGNNKPSESPVVEENNHSEVPSIAGQEVGVAN